MTRLRKPRPKAKAHRAEPLPSSGGFRVRNIHKLEQALMDIYRVGDTDELHRLAIFVLTHTTIDEFLSSAIIGHELSKPPENALLLRLVTRFVDQTQRRTFGNRLDDAKGSQVVSKASYQIAKALNQTRNKFIHEQEMPPVYKGKSITTDDGLYEALNDAAALIRDLAIHARKLSERLNDISQSSQGKGVTQ